MQLLFTFALVLLMSDAAKMIWGTDQYSVGYPPGLGGAVNLGFVVLPQYQLFLCVVGPVIAVAMWLLVDRTRWGRIVRAATQDREMLAALGVNVPMVYAAVFTIGSALAGVGGALAAPRVALVPGMDATIINECFIIVIIGGLGNLWGSFLGALAFGFVVQFGTVLGAELAGRAALPADAGGADHPAVGPARPARDGALTMPQRRHLVASAIVVLLLALLPLAGSRYAVDLATEVLIYVLFALSLNVLIGFTGNISFGHAAYFAIGGYACAILLTTYGWPLVASLPAAVVLAGLVAAVVGYFCVRLTQIYFAMLTLAFAMLVWGVAFKWKEVTGGDDGFTGIKLPAMLAHHVGYFYFTLATVAVGVAALWVICHSAFGLTLVAVRENGVRAGFIGVDTRRMRWAAFTVAGTFGGLAGALFGMYHRGMYIENAFWTESAQVLIMVLLGGIYSFVGPIFGAAVLYLLQVFTNQYTPYWPTVLGLILLVIVLVLPDGLIGLVARVKARQGTRGRRT